MPPRSVAGGGGGAAPPPSEPSAALAGLPPLASLERVPPAPLDQTMVLVDAFVRSSASFLDALARECDARLADAARRVADLRAAVDALEAQVPADVLREVRAEIDELEGRVGVGVGVGAETAETGTDSEPRAAEDADVDALAETYRRMLRVGVSRDAVASKMRSDGASAAVVAAALRS